MRAFTRYPKHSFSTSVTDKKWIQVHFGDFALYYRKAITRWSEDQVKRMYMDLTISWTEL